MGLVSTGPRQEHWVSELQLEEPVKVIPLQSTLSLSGPDVWAPYASRVGRGQ